jgi:hypothetical protein
MATRLRRSVVERPPWLARFHGRSEPVGAGFLIDNQRVMTCAHVVLAALGRSELPDGEVRVELDFPACRGAGRQTATVTADSWVPVDPDDQRGDLAILVLEGGAPPGAAPAPLAAPQSMMDHPFRAHGFPTGRPNGVMATGVLRGATGPGWEWVQLEDVKAQGYRVEGGFSGAPVWDDQERAVVGMVVAEDRGNPQAKAAAMIPVEVLADYWTPLDDLVPSALQRDPAWQTHWEPLARGLSVVAPGSGWYFTGREHALRKLVAWLTSPPGMDG